MTEEEEFFAWLDGELEGDAADRVAARVAASPELTARADQYRRLTDSLRGAFALVAEADSPPPQFQSAQVVELGARSTEHERRSRWLAAPQWAAMAASLAVGLVVGSQFVGSSGQDSIVVIEHGRLVAAAGLEQRLDTGLASAPTEDPRIGLTFRDASGNICRSFKNAAASGLACRGGDDWQIRGLFQGGEGQAGDYRMAAGDDPRLSALIDETIAGEPFDADQEKAARDNDWR